MTNRVKETISIYSGLNSLCKFCRLKMVIKLHIPWKFLYQCKLLSVVLIFNLRLLLSMTLRKIASTHDGVVNYSC